MPLQKQIVPISFAQGLDTKTDSKQVIPGKFLELENAVFISPLRFTKRNGYEQLPQAGTEGSALAVYNDELIAFDGLNVQSYAQALDSFTNKGQALSVNAESLPVIANNFVQSSMDGAYHSFGIKAFAWEDSRGGVRYSVIDAETSQVIVSDVEIDANGETPKVFALGNYVVITYYDGTNLVYRAFAVNDPSTLTAAVDLATDLSATEPIYDAHVIGQRLFFAYNTSSMGNGVAVNYMNSTLNIATMYEEAGEEASIAITIWGDSEQNVWVAYYDGTAISALVVSYELLSVSTPVVVDTVSDVRNLTGIITAETPPTLGTSQLIYETEGALTYDTFTEIVELERNGATITPGTPADFLRSVGLASKLFEYNGTQYVGLAYESELQPTYFISSIDRLIVAKCVALNAGGLTAKSILPEVSFISDSEIMIAWGRKSILTVEEGVIYSTTGVIGEEISFLSTNTYLKANAANNLHFIGSFVSMYDGVSVVEHGFHLFPEESSPTVATSGGNIETGLYQYAVVYEWADNQGNIHESAPSIPLSVNVASGSTNEVTLDIPTLRITAKQSPRADVSIAVYRTEAAGQIFYRVSSVTSPLENDVTVDTVEFVDTLADASIIGNQLLYTTGGVVENIPPPSCSLLTNYRNRLVVIPSEKENQYWISKPIVPGYPVSFTDVFVKAIDPMGGTVTAITQMDEKLIIGKEHSIFVVAGDGPNEVGQQDSLSTTQLVTTDAGIENPRSVVSMPLGIMFKSGKGMYLLDRSLQTHYIGADVERYNDLTITSAQLIPDTNQVRFTTAEGTCLVYDYFFKQWSIFTNIEAVDSAIFQDRFCFIKADGLVMKETPGQFTDGNRFIKLKIRTSWLSFAGLQGFQRIYQALILGEYKSLHKLIVSVAYDFNPYPTQQTYVDATVLAPYVYGESSPYGDETVYGGEYPLYQFRIDMERQKCQAVQFILEEVPLPAYGEGLSLSGFTTLVGMKQGLYKIPAARQAA